MAALSAAITTAAAAVVVAYTGEKHGPRSVPSLDTLAPPPAPSKCSACGSHEFLPHRGRHVCAYCRTGAG